MFAGTCLKLLRAHAHMPAPTPLHPLLSLVTIVWNQKHPGSPSPSSSVPFSSHPITPAGLGMWQEWLILHRHTCTCMRTCTQAVGTCILFQFSPPPPTSTPSVAGAAPLTSCCCSRSADRQTSTWSFCVFLICVDYWTQHLLCCTLICSHRSCCRPTPAFTPDGETNRAVRYTTCCTHTHTTYSQKLRS